MFGWISLGRQARSPHGGGFLCEPVLCLSLPEGKGGVSFYFAKPAVQSAVEFRYVRNALRILRRNASASSGRACWEQARKRRVASSVQCSPISITSPGR